LGDALIKLLTTFRPGFTEGNSKNGWRVKSLGQKNVLRLDCGKQVEGTSLTCGEKKSGSREMTGIYEEKLSRPHRKKRKEEHDGGKKIKITHQVWG